MNKQFVCKLAVAAALCLCMLPLQAEDYSFTLLINGRSYVFNLAEKPVITYEANELTVKVTAPSSDPDEQSTVSEISVPVAEVQKIDLEKVNEIKETVGVEAVKRAPEFVNGQLSLSGLPAGSAVSVVNAGGKTMVAVKASDRGEATVSLHQLPPGVYIVRTVDSAVKIVNK